MRVLLGLGLLACGAALAPQAVAEITMTDLQVAARAMSFMENPLSGRVRVGLVYSDISPQSRRQAEQLRSELGAGLRVGGIELVPVTVELSNADTADVDLFVLTEAVPLESKSLAAVAKTRRIPCVTTDIEQVESGACVMGVRSRPRVEIFVNRDAAGESGFRFATAFRVMITEI